jgi:putative acetyltransferase
MSLRRIALEDPAQDDVRALIDALDAYQKPMYPIESFYGIDMNALKQPEVSFAVARNDLGEALGCGAVVQTHGHDVPYGEIKRMFVLPQCRGMGVAQDLLHFLQSQAQQRGLNVLRLETGVKQLDAIALYERFGFAVRPFFAPYPNDPLSVFMEKRLQ